MNHQKDDSLDRLLRDWAAAERPDEAHLEALRGRISQAADQLEGAGTEIIGIPDGDLTPGGARKSARPAIWPRRLGWFTLGAAAAAVILAAVLMVSRLRPRQPPGIPRQPQVRVPPEARLDPGQLAAQAKLLAAMKEVFAGRLTWIAETDGKVVLGIEPETDASPGGSQPITIRLVVMSRRPGESTWRHRFSVDCIVQNEQVVELAPQDGSQTQVALWAHLLPDGMIAVDTSLGLDPSRPEAASSSEVQRPQLPQRILQLRTDDIEYQVFQTVAVLPKEAG